MIEGIILKGIGGFYYVDTAEGLIECKARGRFRKTVGKPIVGDRVTLEIQPEDGTGYLQTIAPRKNSLIRPAVANLDLVVAVASAAPPVTDPFLPIVVSVLEKENAVKDYRTLIGSTNPAEAAEGTIRKDFALSQRENSVHGSDSVESAKREIAYFFVDSEIQP